MQTRLNLKMPTTGEWREGGREGRRGWRDGGRYREGREGRECSKGKEGKEKAGGSMQILTPDLPIPNSTSNNTKKEKKRKEM